MTATTPLSEHTFWSLGRFKPHECGYAEISRGFPKFVELRLQATVTQPEVRDPDNHGNMLRASTLLYKRQEGDPSERTDVWHHDESYDDDGENGDPYLVMWASAVPTLIQKHGRNKTIYQPAPYEVVAFRNGSFRHKMPSPRGIERSVLESRWFARWIAYNDQTPVNIRARGVYAYEI